MTSSYVIPVAQEKLSVGTTPGTASVDQGIAYYTIPIEVPPGRKGMQPDLSITYNSNAGNGLLGVGFSLSGLSAITRVPATIEHDGFNRGVTYDETDRFALDGQRLISINGWGDEATCRDIEYRTYPETWQRVIPAQSNQCGNPTSFEVTRPDGTVLEYGTTEDASIKSSAASSSFVRVWALKKVTDTNGNYMTITYDGGDPEKGEYYPVEIKYAGNDRVLLPTRSVKFEYEEREDISFFYQAGSKVEATKRLSKITTYVSEKTVKEYRFSYDLSYTTQRSLLTSVKECGVDKDGAMVCLQPTEFTYPDQSQRKLAKPATELVWTPIPEQNLPDRGSGYLSPYLTHVQQDAQGEWYSVGDHARMLDLNGDGHVDFALYMNSLPWDTWINTGGLDKNTSATPNWLSQDDGSSVARGYTPPFPYFFAEINPFPGKDGRQQASDWGTRLIDVNGDGLQDMLFAQEQSSQGVYHSGYRDAERTRANLASLNDGDGWGGAGNFAPPEKEWLARRVLAPGGVQVNVNDGLKIVDLNSDGLPDLVKSNWNPGEGGMNRDVEQLNSKAWLNNGAGWQTTRAIPPAFLTLASVFPNTSTPVSVDVGGDLVDVNGDGKLDAIWAVKMSGDHIEGTMFLPENMRQNNTWLDVGLHTLSPAYKVPDNLWISHAYREGGPVVLSPNSSFWPVGTYYRIDDGARLIDINGDGLVDLVRLHKEGASFPQKVILNTGTGWSNQSHTNYEIGSGGWLTHTITSSSDGSNIPYNVNDGALLIDLNGDALLDFIHAPQDGEHGKAVFLNTGRGWTNISQYQLPDKVWTTKVYTDQRSNKQASIRGAQFVDLNGDGLVELIHDPDDGPASVWLNTGSGWKESPSPRYTLPPGTWLSGGHDIIEGDPYQALRMALNKVDDGARFADLNGDGLLDIVHFHNQNTVKTGNEKPNSQYVRKAWLNSGRAQQDRVISIENGVHRSTEITYGPLSDPSVFKPAPGTLGGGLQKLNDIPWVVNSFVEKNNNTKYRHYTYEYEGLLSEDVRFQQRREGQQVDGFKQITRVDKLSGHRQITSYRDNYGHEHQFTGYNRDFYYKPELVGLIDSTVVTSKEGVRVAKNANIYQYWPIYAKTNAEWRFDVIKNYQVRLRQQVKVMFDEQGQSTDSIRTQFAYDQYRNVTRRDEETFTNGVLIENQSTTHLMRYNNDEEKWRIGFRDKAATVAHNQNVILSTQDEGTFNPWGIEPDQIFNWEYISYDGEMNVKSVKRLFDWDGNNTRYLETTFTHSALGMVHSIKDPNGENIVIEYDDSGTYEISRKVFDEESNLLFSTNSRHDPSFGVRTMAEDANGNQITYDLDAFGRVTAMYGPDPEQGNAKRIKLATYSLEIASYPPDSDISSNLTCHKTKQRIHWDDDEEENWHWKSECRDAFGRTVLEKSKKGDKKESEEYVLKIKKYHDETGRLNMESLPYFSTTDNKKWVNFGYDDQRRRLNKITSEGLIMSISATDVKSAVKTFAAEDKPSDILSRTILEFDVQGRVLKRTDPENPEGKTGISNYKYNAVGRPISVIDPNNVENTTSYTPIGLKKSIKNGDTGEVTFTYNSDGLLRKETDALKDSIVYAYDALARVSKKEVYKSGQKTYWIEYKYGDLESDDAKAKGLLYSVEKLSGANNSVTKTTYQYDAYGRVRHKTIRFEGKDYNFRYAYNPMGQDTLQTYPDGSKLLTTYYDDGNIHELKLQGPASNDPVKTYVTYSDYTPMGQPKTIKYGNGLNGIYTFDGPRGLLQTHKLAPGTGSKALIDKTYAWHPTLELKTITDNLDAKNTQTFEYSNLGRLIKATGPYAQDGTEKVLNYAYDLGGNLTTKHDLQMGYASGSNRLEKIIRGGNTLEPEYYANGNLKKKPCAVSNCEWTYLYDPESHLLEVQKDGKNVSSYTYDHDGRLIQEINTLRNRKTIYISDTYVIEETTEEKSTADETANVVTNHVKYINGPSGGHLVSFTTPEDDVTLVSSSVNESVNKSAFSFGGLLLSINQFTDRLLTPEVQSQLQGSIIALVLLLTCMAVCWLLFTRLRRKQSSLVRKRLWVSLCVPPVIASTLLLTFIAGSQPAMAMPAHTENPEVTVYYYHHDHVNSVNLITDDKGDEKYRVNFKPYGEVVSNALSDEYPHEFTGQHLDDVSNLYYYGARFYDPDLGRFLTPDSESGNDPFLSNALNRYAYAGGNPVIYEDPTGHLFVALLIGFIVGAVVAAATDVITQSVQIAKGEREHYDGWQIFTAFAIGGMTGMIGAGVGSGVSAGLTQVGLSLAKNAGVVVGQGLLRVAGAASGYISGAIGSVAAQSTSNLLDMMQGKEVDWGNLALASIIGGSFGAVGGVFGATKVSAGRLALKKVSMGNTSGISKVGYAVVKKASVNKVQGLIGGLSKTDAALTWLNSAQGLTRDAIDAESQINEYFQNRSAQQAAEVTAMAFSTRGTHNVPQTLYQGHLLFGITQGQAATANDLLEWSDTRDNLIRRWVEAGQQQ